MVIGGDLGDKRGTCEKYEVLREGNDCTHYDSEVTLLERQNFAGGSISFFTISKIRAVLRGQFIQARGDNK